MNQSDIRMRQNVCRRLSAARRRQKYEPGLRATALFHVLTLVMTRLVSRYTLWNMLMSASIKMIVHTITFNQFNTHYLVIFQIMAFIRLMLAAFAGVECVAKQTANWRDRREITRGFEPRKGELKIV